MRIEAPSSSRIEGLALSHKPLALALAEVPGSTSTAKAVAKNVYAMKRAVELAAKEEFSIEMIRDIHATLCPGTQLDAIAGEIRTTQNWIGKGQNGPPGPKITFRHPLNR